MTPTLDADELGGMEMPSYGIRRILASLSADPKIASAQIALIDVGRPNADAYVEAIESFEPDLIGISIYVWSTPCLVEAARRIKRRYPDVAIVFGGPSARTAMFDLPPYANPHQYLDAIVSWEGEISFCEIARLPEFSRAALESVPGLDLPAADGWIRTGPRPSISNLDGLASPFALGLMSEGTVAYLETYRGCPLSCRFCEWGMNNGSKNVFSADYLARELEAFGRYDASAVFLLDAGLNLNAKGFQNLCEAEARTGYLRGANFWCEVYPSHVRDEHLEFLSNTGASYLGIGLQSIDPSVLKALSRPFKQDRFEPVVRQLAEVADSEIQIIFGLPGDTPEGFLRTLEYARSLPVAVRAYHCLVLPDALMTRSRPEWQIRYDPITLEMTSCAGWEDGKIAEMRTHVTEAALACGGKAGNYWWYFPHPA